MPNMDVESIVRCGLALNWIPGFALCLAQGIVTEVAVPVVGIIPMTGSLIVTCLHFYARRPARLRLGHRHSLNEPVGDSSRWLTKAWKVGLVPLLLDSFVFGGLLTVLTITWCFINGWWNASRRDLTLVVYATMPLIISW